MRHICLDIETTGLDPKSGHRTIEIACIEMINLVKTDKFFQCYINPKRDVPFEAFKIHNISTEFLQDKPYFENIATEFLDFIGDSTLVIHNAPFDTKFLNFELEANGFRNLAEKNKIVDNIITILAQKCTYTQVRSEVSGAQFDDVNTELILVFQSIDYLAIYLLI